MCCGHSSHWSFTLFFFRHVSKTEEFMRLDEESLKKLLNRVTLNAADDSILDSILTWYKFDKAARETKVDHIVKNCFNTVRWKWSETVLRGSDLEQMMPRLLLECKTAGTRRGLTEVIFIAGGEGYVGNDERYVFCFFSFFFFTKSC